MRDLLLLAAVTAAFVLGYFVLKKLDCLLEQSRREWSLSLPSCDKRLRIGFSDPLVAGSLSDVLGRYSMTYPDSPVCLCSGPDEELLRRFSEGELDIIFMPESIENPTETDYDSRQISLTRTPVCTKLGGLSIEPVTGGTITQKVLYSKMPKASYAPCFIKCLLDRKPGQGTQKLE